MSIRPHLDSHPRVWNTCLLLLHQKGYTLWCTPDASDDLFETVIWYAEKDEQGVELKAENPLELLGLAVLYEETGPDVDLEGPNLLGQIFASAFPDLILEEESATDDDDDDDE